MSFSLNFFLFQFKDILIINFARLLLSQLTHILFRIFITTSVYNYFVSSYEIEFSSAFDMFWTDSHSLKSSSFPVLNKDVLTINSARFPHSLSHKEKVSETESNETTRGTWSQWIRRRWEVFSVAPTFWGLFGLLLSGLWVVADLLVTQVLADILLLSWVTSCYCRGWHLTTVMANFLLLSWLTSYYSRGWHLVTVIWLYSKPVIALRGFTLYITSIEFLSLSLSYWYLVKTFYVCITQSTIISNTDRQTLKIFSLFLWQSIDIWKTDRPLQIDIFFNQID